MTVLLKLGWKSKVLAIELQIYPLSDKAQRVVDNNFDEMHKQSRLQYTTNLIPFSFPMFVIYRTDERGKTKSHAVVDIRKLNNLVLPDSYSLSLQLEIIANV